MITLEIRVWLANRNVFSTLNAQPLKLVLTKSAWIHVQALAVSMLNVEWLFTEQFAHVLGDSKAIHSDNVTPRNPTHHLRLHRDHVIPIHVDHIPFALL